jgi:arylsulfatase A-like enzyme
MALALLLSACGSELLAPPPPAVLYDDPLASGRLASFDGVAGGVEETCGDETRFSVTLQPGAEIRLPMELGDEPVLTVAACAGEDLAASGPDGGAAEPALRIEVRGVAGLTSELALPLSGGLTDGGGPAWREGRLDLRAHAGHRIDLTLRAAGPAGSRLLLSDLHLRHRPRPAQEARSGRADRSGRPPILLISLDTLRADALGPEATPALHAFAGRAERWAPHYAAASWTKPSHASLLTGYPPEVHGAQLEEQAIRAGVPTLAERLAAAGYRTAGLVYDCEWLDPKWGFGRGFTEYRVMPWNADMAVRASVDWMMERRDEPFFYFLHLFTPHSDRAVLPYEATGVDRASVAERFGVEDYGCRRGRCASGLLHALNEPVGQDSPMEPIEPIPGEEEILRYLYREGVATTDAALGRLFRDLREGGLFDSMMIVVTSDHGEAFFEHGLVLHSSLHREVLEVPLLVKWPEGSPHAERAGTARDMPSASVDVAPTVLAVAGIDPAESGGALPGSPLPERQAVTPIFAGTTQKAILTRRLHAIFTPGGTPGSAGEGRPEVAELYDIAEDPFERRDVAAERPDDLARLRARLVAQVEETKRWLRELGVEAGRPEDAPELTPEERERLEALGYLN